MAIRFSFPPYHIRPQRDLVTIPHDLGQQAIGLVATPSGSEIGGRLEEIGSTVRSGTNCWISMVRAPVASRPSSSSGVQAT